MPENANTFRQEINDIRDDVVETKVTVARIEQTANDSNRRLETIEHSIKNLRQVAEMVAIHTIKIKQLEGDIEEIKDKMVDQKTYEVLSKKIETYEKRVVGLVVALGGPILAFLGSKMGIDLSWVLKIFQ